MPNEVYLKWDYTQMSLDLARRLHALHLTVDKPVMYRLLKNVSDLQLLDVKIFTHPTTEQCGEPQTQRFNFEITNYFKLCAPWGGFPDYNFMTASKEELAMVPQSSRDRARIVSFFRTAVKLPYRALCELFMSYNTPDIICHFGQFNWWEDLSRFYNICWMPRIGRKMPEYEEFRTSWVMNMPGIYYTPGKSYVHLLITDEMLSIKPVKGGVLLNLGGTKIIIYAEHMSGIHKDALLNGSPLPDIL